MQGISSHVSINKKIVIECWIWLKLKKTAHLYKLVICKIRLLYKAHFELCSFWTLRCDLGDKVRKEVFTETLD